MRVPSTLANILIYGKIGEGKSLMTAVYVHSLMKEYKRMEKKYPDLPKRKLYSNIVFSDDFYNEYKDRIVYWENVRQLIPVRNADIVYDEIANDLPADGWQSLNKKIRQVFSHCRKRGNRIIANTQDYKAVDINFRRQCKIAFKVRKFVGNRDISATLPPPKRIWGLILVRQFDPDDIEVESNAEKLKKLSFGMFPIRKKYISIYDTTKELPPYMPDTFEHSVIKCEHIRAMEKKLGRELKVAEIKELKKKHPNSCFFMRVEHKKI